MALELGDPVRIEMTKWVDRPHWHIPGRWLGTDEHGDWIGIPSGTRMIRPGMETVSRNDQVGLVPHTDAPDSERWWVATFHGPGSPLGLSVYVDITTPPRWDGATLRTVDLDLDVVRENEGRIYVDDEDEFAEHRITLGYPADVSSGAEQSCARVRDTVAAGRSPYDGSHQPWLDLLPDLPRL
jgi:uncharacterized protein